MKYAFVIGSLLALDGCAGAAKESAGPSAYVKMEALGRLMKNEINPAFSKLSFLVFHGDSMDEDPAVIVAELRVSATALRSAIGRLRVWNHPPTTTEQGREVFTTYASSVDQAAERLVAAIERDDRPTVRSQLDRIAETCNSCHHFFRLDIEDSVTGALSESDPRDAGADDGTSVGMRAPR